MESSRRKESSRPSGPPFKRQLSKAEKDRLKELRDLGVNTRELSIDVAMKMDMKKLTKKYLEDLEAKGGDDWRKGLPAWVHDVVPDARLKGGRSGRIEGKGRGDGGPKRKEDRDKSRPSERGRGRGDRPRSPDRGRFPDADRDAGPWDRDMGPPGMNACGPMPNNMMDGGIMAANMMGGMMPNNMMGGMMPNNMMGGMMPNNMMGGMMPNNMMGDAGMMANNMMGGMMPNNMLGAGMLPNNNMMGGMMPNNNMMGGMMPNNMMGGMGDAGMMANNMMGGMNNFGIPNNGMNPGMNDFNNIPDRIEDGRMPDMNRMSPGRNGGRSPPRGSRRRSRSREDRSRSPIGMRGRSPPFGNRGRSPRRSRTPPRGRSPPRKAISPRRDNPTQQFNNESAAMAIIPVEFPAERLTSEEALAIKREIIDWIDHVDVGPRFEGSRYVDGHLEFICSDMESKMFLANFLREKQIWGLKLVDAKDLVRKTTVAISLTEQEDPSKIISRLLKQNRPMSTELWRFHSVRKDNNGFQLLVDIDDDTKRFLDGVNWMLCYCTARVPVRVVDDVPEQRPY